MAPRAKTTSESENVIENVEQKVSTIPENDRRVFSPENMRYYEYAREVPKEALKAFNNGRFSGTDINPMWRLKMLTEMFGPVGIGWYYTIDKQWLEEANGEIASFTNISLYVKTPDGTWSAPIQGTGGNKFVEKGKSGLRMSDEHTKMSLTDALSVACKALGIGANVYFANDPTKYTDNTETSGDRNPPPQKPPAKTEPPTITAVVELTENPSAVSQDMLTTLVKTILDKLKSDSAAKSKVAAIIKQFNSGAAAYKNVANAESRKKIYDALYSDYMKPAESGKE